MTFSNNNALFTAIGKYGLGSILAIYLTWNIASQIPAITLAVEKSALQHDRMEEKMNAAILNGKSRDDVLQKLLRSLCINSAENKEETARCNL